MITLERLIKKALSLVQEYGEKRHFFNLWDALVFTTAPYTHRGNERKHKAILAYLERYAPKSFASGYYLDKKISEDSPLWMFWYQGFKFTPPLLKFVNRSIEVNKGKHKVILLDQDNLSQYVTLPDYVWEKVDKGIITLTHLSDLVRMALLSEYGGYWVDATVLFSAPLPDYDTPFYSIKGLKKNPRHVNGGNGWSAYFIGTGEKNAVAKYVLDLFLAYWKHESHMIDYFLVDYSINLAYQRFPEFAEVIASNPTDNPHVGQFMDHINDEYSSEGFDKLLHSQTIHKLSYKLPLAKGNTIAKHIIDLGKDKLQS